MDFKNLLRNVLAGYIGYLIISILYSFLFIAVALHLGSDLIRKIYWLLLIINIVIIIGGFVIGYKQRQNKTVWYKVFSPNKPNLFLALLLGFIFVLIGLLIDPKIFVYSFNLKIVTLLPFSIILGTLSFAILYFPFSALCHFIYKKRKTQDYKKVKVWIILLLILLNPLFVTVSTTLSKVFMISASQIPCEVGVTGFAEDSPAQNAGMQINEVIKEIDGNTIVTLKDISDYMNTITSVRRVQVTTDRGTYELDVRYDEENKRYIIGAELRQFHCPTPIFDFSK